MVKESTAALQAIDLVDKIKAEITSHPGCTVDYVSVVDRITLKQVERVDRNSLVALAVKINNKVRLIDNSLLYAE